MLSKEFIIEAPQINPATGEPYTSAERDAEYEKNKAQGAKNLQGLKDIGSKISQGVQNFFKPAAAQQAAAPAHQAATPAAADVPSANPMGQDPAQTAAAQPVQAFPVSSQPITATELPAGGMRAAAPTTMKGGYGSGTDNQSVTPQNQPLTALSTDPATRAQQLADRSEEENRAAIRVAAGSAPAPVPASTSPTAPIKSAETNPELKSAADRELTQYRANAGLTQTPFAGQTDEFGGLESPATTAAAEVPAAGEPVPEPPAGWRWSTEADSIASAAKAATTPVTPSADWRTIPPETAGGQSVAAGKGSSGLQMKFNPVTKRVEPVASGQSATPPPTSAASMAGSMRSTGKAASGYQGSAGAQAIKKANPSISNVNSIQAGTTIKIPGKPDYKVKPGDTLDKIAAAQGIKENSDMKRILELSGLSK